MLGQPPGLSPAQVPADEADFPKSQTLTWKNGYSVVHKVPGAAPTTTRQLPQAPAKLPAPLPAATQPPRLPKWVQFEHQTLRFSAFFEETVPNSPAEAWRVRRCHVLHFLGDGTTQVVEPKDGSGLPQGTLVLHRRVPRAGFPPKKAATASFLAASEEEDTPDERAFIGPADLGVGRCVCLHGRTFHLIDADAFTRDFMQAHGMPQPPALPCPASPIDTYKEQRSRPSGLTRTDPQSPSRFAEALLGRAPSTKRLQRFLEADRRVLRYWAVWDDPAGAGGQGAVRRPYSIAYHLEDDSVEVVELPQGNGGREFYHFLKRAPLPKVGGCLMCSFVLCVDGCWNRTFCCRCLRAGATSQRMQGWLAFWENRAPFPPPSLLGNFMRAGGGVRPTGSASGGGPVRAACRPEGGPHAQRVRPPVLHP